MPAEPDLSSFNAVDVQAAREWLAVRERLIKSRDNPRIRYSFRLEATSPDTLPEPQRTIAHLILDTQR